MNNNDDQVAASELARSGGAEASPGRKEDRRRSRTDLKKRLQQLALTSETGSASVIEVIEPNSSEDETWGEWGHKPRKDEGEYWNQETPPSHYCPHPPQLPMLVTTIHRYPLVARDI